MDINQVISIHAAVPTNSYNLKDVRQRTIDDFLIREIEPTMPHVILPATRNFIESHWSLIFISTT